MAETTVRAVPRTATLKLPEKLAWTLGNGGRVITVHAMSAFLLVFYTDVFGIPPAVAGTLFLVARMVDGINDPVMGYLIDHLPRTRWGRYRPVLFWGAILTALCFAALFAAPRLSLTGKIIWAYATYLLFGFVSDLVAIPARALMPAMTDDTSERNALSSLAGIAGIITYMAVAALSLGLVGAFATATQGWFNLALIYGALSILLIGVMAVSVRERAQPAQDEKYRLRDVYRLITQNPPLLTLVASFVFSSLSVSLIQPAAVLFFKYNVGRPELFGLTSLVTTVFMLLGIGLFPTIARRLGRRQTFWLFGLIGVAGNVALYFSPVNNIALIYLFSIVLAVGMGPPGALNQAMTADAADYAEWKHGTRADGVVFAVYSFGAKLTSGLSGAIMGWVLAGTGYAPNAAAQTPSALQGITAVKHLAVAAALIVSAVLISLNPLTEERFAEISAELAVRRAAKQP
jgi:sugar (glycoside-pentoside-hexuronide) transporter